MLQWRHLLVGALIAVATVGGELLVDISSGWSW
jgi:hypothetical protein